MASRHMKLIKNNQIRVGGTACVGAGEKSAPVRSSTPCVPSGAVPSEPMQARIVESNTDYAIIEVTCSCGQKTHVQCNYVNTVKTQ
jgi:hypothetical protein